MRKCNFFIVTYIEARADGNLLENAAVEAALKNTQRQANTILEPQLEFTPAQVRGLKDFYEEFFNHPPSSTEAKALAIDTGKALQEKCSALLLQQQKQDQYPFLQILGVVAAALQKAIGKPYAWYLTDLPALSEELLTAKETILDPLEAFWKGPQLEIYRTAAEFVNRDRLNFTYIDGPEAEAVFSMLGNAECYKGGCMQQLKQWVETLRQKVAVQLTKECDAAKEKLDKLQEKLRAMPEFQRLSPEQQTEILLPVSRTQELLAKQNLIAVVRENLRRFEEEEYPKLLTRMASWTEPPPQPIQPALPGEAKKPPTRVAETKVEYIANRAIKIPFEKAWLADETDVEEYLQSAKEAFLREIRQGKRIQI